MLEAGDCAFSGGGDLVLASDEAVGANSREVEADMGVDVVPEGDCLDALDAGRREGVVVEAEGVVAVDEARRDGWPPMDDRMGVLFCACDVCGRGGCGLAFAGDEADAGVPVVFLLVDDEDGDGETADERGFVELSGVRVVFGVEAEADELSRPDAEDDDAVGLLYVGGDLTVDAEGTDGFVGVATWVVVFLDVCATVLCAVEAVDADKFEPARSRTATVAPLELVTLDAGAFDPASGVSSEREAMDEVEASAGVVVDGCL